MQMTIRNKTNMAAACGAMLFTAGLCTAQSDGSKAAPEPTKYFHLDFVVKELDGGKVISARHYTTTISNDANSHNCSIRSGSKVPVPVGGNGTDNTQYTYIDVGVNLDCHNAKLIEGDLGLYVSADISTAVPGPKQPLIRQTRWSADVIVTIGKPTTIFSSDDITNKGQMQLELTATPIPAR